MATLGFLAIDNLLRLAVGSGDPTNLRGVALTILDEAGSPILCRAPAFSTWVELKAGVGIIMLVAQGLAIEPNLRSCQRPPSASPFSGASYPIGSHCGPVLFIFGLT